MGGVKGTLYGGTVRVMAVRGVSALCGTVENEPSSRPTKFARETA